VFLQHFQGRDSAMNWSTERGALIAKTMAFVQSVTGHLPDASILDASIPVTIAKTALVSSTASDTAPTDNANSDPANLEQTSVLPPVETAPRSEARKDVQSRVAAFQAHQHRFQREREAYFNSVLTKAGAVPQSHPKAPGT
jgi:hypothetical protein